MNFESKKPNLSFWGLWNLSFGFFGVQIAYALQSANISRIFATLGAIASRNYPTPVGLLLSGGMEPGPSMVRLLEGIHDLALPIYLIPGDTFSVGPTGANSSDNGNAKLLSNLDDARVLNGGTLTLNGAIGGLTTQVGSAARQAQYSADAQQVIHDEAQAARDSIAGVNLDEEAANMLRLQQAYQAAAQVISTADTMFQSILNAVR